MFYKGSAISGNGGGSGDAVWGAITGTLSDQTDLQTALNAKQDVIDSTHKLSASLVDGLATVATTGAYGDLSGTPTIPTVPENDNTTISLNTQDKLQAIGVIDKNSGDALGFWHGTQAEYDVGGEFKDGYIDWECNGASAITYPASANWYDIAYGNGTWVAIIRVSNDVNYSTDDGATWHTVNIPKGYDSSAGGGWTAVAFGNNTFVAVDRNSTNYTTGGISYSTDNGQTWTNVNNPGGWWNIAFGNNTFVATSLFANPYVSYSTDNGQTWTDATSITVPTNVQLKGIAYGDGTFVITGSGNSPTDFAAYSDDDGDTWTAVTLPSAQNWDSVAFGNGMFVAISQTNKAAYSTDKGRTWTEVTLPVSATWQAITFGDNKFVAVASNNGTKPVIYTIDGIHWLQTSFEISSAMSIAYGNGKFMTVPKNSTAANLLTILNVYTDTDTPTTASTVYTDTEGTASALTITAVGTDTIMLSNTNIYTHNPNGDDATYYSVGESYPNYVCNIDGVGLKIANNDIANLASYTAFTGATGSVAGSAGLVPAPAATDNDKYLKGDGTWATVSGGGLQNTATGSDSLTILGTPTNAITAINIGDSSSVATTDGIAIGVHATSYGGQSIAIGSGYDGSEAVAYSGGVAIGSNTLAGNSNSSNPSVAILGYAPDNAVAILGNANDNEFTVSNYLLMDLSTGKIPNDRIDGATGSFTSQDGKTVTVTNGVITSIV